jgi:hypothetical protein
MENRSSLAELRSTIQRLEVQQSMQGELLKEQFYITYESSKPANILRSTISEVISSPYLVNNLLGTAAGLATGYLFQKIVVGASGNLFRKLPGIMMQLGDTSTVAQHPDTVKSIGQNIYQHLLRLWRDKS